MLYKYQIPDVLRVSHVWTQHWMGELYCVRYSYSLPVLLMGYHIIELH